MNALQMQSFQDELSKLASVGSVLGGWAGRTAIGAGLGGVAGGVASRNADPESRAKNIVRGAIGGAALGAGSKAITATGRKDVANMARRNWYGLTGRGADSTKDAVRMKLLSRGSSAAEREAYQKGYLNLPGMAKGLMKDPKGMLLNTAKRQGALGLGFTALGVGTAANEMRKPTEEGGPGKARRVLGGLGSAAGFALNPAGMITGQLLGSAAGKAGELVGGGVDRLAGGRRPGLVPAGQPSLVPAGEVG